MTKTSTGLNEDLLRVYLHDHLAGATGGVELSRHLAEQQAGSAYGPELAVLADDINADRVALREIEHYGLFDYVLVNEDLEEATKQLVSIFRAEECRRHRAARHAERLLAEGRGFGGSTPPG